MGTWEAVTVPICQLRSANVLWVMDWVMTPYKVGTGLQSISRIFCTNPEQKRVCDASIFIFIQSTNSSLMGQLLKWTSVKQIN